MPSNQEVNFGNVISSCLPDPKAASTVAEILQQNSTGEAMKVLIVDDCNSTRSVLAKYMSKWDFEYVIASDGAGALELVEQDDSIRMALVDWMMPKMDGPTLIEKIRSLDHQRTKYIIMLTAKVGSEVVERVFQCGADDYMPKPLNEEDLFCRLSEGRNILERQDNVGRVLDGMAGN